MTEHSVLQKLLVPQVAAAIVQNGHSAVEGPSAPWGGEPGGALMVSLDRPIRYFYDTGLFDRVDLRSADDRGVQT